MVWPSACAIGAPPDLPSVWRRTLDRRREAARLGDHRITPAHHRRIKTDLRCRNDKHRRAVRSPVLLQRLPLAAT
jgi:hypothetical protein